MPETSLDILRQLAAEPGFLQGMEEACVARMAPYFALSTFRKGEALFREGEAGDFMGLIVSGKMGVRKRTEFSDRQVVLATNTRGSIIGEFSLFDRRARSATVEAVEDTTVLILDRASLDAFLRSEPRVGVHFLERIIRVLAVRLRNSAERVTSLF